MRFHLIKNKNQPWRKFLLLIALFALYFLYLIYEYGIQDGGLVTLLTWSFFVLCTPVADAGFLLDFPIRLLYKIKMIYTEIIVWIIAISFSAYGIFYQSQIFEVNYLMKIFKGILINPSPFWLIIILCGIGTFLSIFLGDQIYDVLENKTIKFNHQFLIKLIGLFVLILSIVFLYYQLLKELGISF